MIRHVYRNRPLTKEDKAFNQIRSRIRSTVKRVFGVLKLHYDVDKARYLGLGRNCIRVEIKFVAQNIKPDLSIKQEKFA